MNVRIENKFVAIAITLLMSSFAHANPKYSKCECGPHPTVGNVMILGGYNGTRWEPLAQFIGKRPMFGYNGSAGAMENAKEECETAMKASRDCPSAGGSYHYNPNGDFGA